MAAALDKLLRLDGIVEADDTFILESFEAGGGIAACGRQARRQGKQAWTVGQQILVLVARDRSGKTTDAVLSKLIAPR